MCSRDAVASTVRAVTAAAALAFWPIGASRAQEPDPSTASAVAPATTEESGAGTENGTERTGEGERRRRRERGIDLSLSYGNWGRYNGWQFSAGAALLRTENLRLTAYYEAGEFGGSAQPQFDNLSDSARALLVRGVGLQLRPSQGRTYGVLGAGLYLTRYVIPRPEELPHIGLTHRTGLGTRLGLGYLIGAGGFVEASANFYPLPGEVPERRRTALVLHVGGRF